MAALPEPSRSALSGGTGFAGAEAGNGPMVPRPFCVERRVRETYDTWTLSLAPVQGGQLEVGPGQFTMLYAFGVGEVPISVSVFSSESRRE